MRLTKHAAIFLAGFALAAHGTEPTAKKATPAAKATRPDPKFLEYLGTLEADEENWTDIASTALAPADPKHDVKSEAAAKSAERK
jgi:hypothetical protein